MINLHHKDYDNNSENFLWYKSWKDIEEGWELEDEELESLKLGQKILVGDDHQLQLVQITEEAHDQ